MRKSLKGIFTPTNRNLTKEVESEALLRLRKIPPSVGPDFGRAEIWARVRARLFRQEGRESGGSFSSLLDLPQKRARATPICQEKLQRDEEIGLWSLFEAICEDFVQKKAKLSAWWSTRKSCEISIFRGAPRKERMKGIDRRARSDRRSIISSFEPGGDEYLFFRWGWPE